MINSGYAVWITYNMPDKIEYENVSKIKDCYGCGVCVISCPKNIVEIKFNTKGFLEPTIIDQTKSIECGLCLNNCAYNHDQRAAQNAPLCAYAAWSNNERIRFKSSSGGICFELCKFYINQGFKICGVKYEPEDNIASHVICSTIEELNQIFGSKYVQSNTIKGFEQFNNNDKFVVIGTPCQIDSVKRYIKKRKIEENFVLIDFFCHGVPSMKLWNKFSASQRNKIGNFNSVTWRNKVDGWHKSYRLDIVADSGEYHHTGLKFDDFFNLYFSNAALSPACFDKCKYKQDQSSADIRIGDMWGADYSKNKEGVNSVICFTEKGNKAVQEIDCTIKRHTFEEVLSGQMNFLPIRDNFFYRLNPLIIADLENWNEITTRFRKMFLKKRIMRKVKSIIKIFSKK